MRNRWMGAMLACCGIVMILCAPFMGDAAPWMPLTGMLLGLATAVVGIWTGVQP